MPRLLVVHHTTSPALQAMLEAALAGGRDPELDGVDVVPVPALAASVPDVLAADGFLLGTPANIGYMSGALKHFFDQIYYPCLQAKKGAPFGLYVHGNSDTTGAVRAVAAITAGLGWAEVTKPVEATGPVTAAVERQCYELGATVAANLLLLARTPLADLRPSDRQTSTPWSHESLTRVQFTPPVLPSPHPPLPLRPRPAASGPTSRACARWR